MDQARRKAKELIGRIAQGEDPAQDQMDHKKGFTFGDLIDMYMERHAPRKRSASNDVTIIQKRLLIWKNRKLSSITRADVSHLHTVIGKEMPYAANRMVALIRKMFNLVNIWGVFKGDNPATRIEFFPEEKRDRFIQGNELPLLIKSASSEKFMGNFRFR